MGMGVRLRDAQFWDDFVKANLDRHMDIENEDAYARLVAKGEIAPNGKYCGNSDAQRRDQPQRSRKFG